MLQAIAVQAVYAPQGVEPAPRVRQVIIVPAAKMVWVRSVSAEHPKAVWKKRPTFAYDLAKPFASTALETAMNFNWDMRFEAEWHLTGDPVGFQMTDAEYLELDAGRMPRNVALRFTRALEATRQTVMGATPTAPPADYRGNSNCPRLNVTARGRTKSRLMVELQTIANAVTRHDMGTLSKITPSQARARSAGVHHNEHDLPGAVAAPKMTMPQSAPVVDPVPIMPKPEIRVVAADGSIKPGDLIMAADGVVYVARHVDADQKDLSDVELFKRAYADSMNVLLLGEPGTGKTRALLAAFPDAIVVSVTGDTEVSDLIGGYVPSGPDSFIWVDGPIPRGMEEGRMVIMDEIGMADSKVLALLYPLMDKKGEARKLLVTANPARGTITATNGFGIAGTTNPNAKGVHLAEPLLSRCAITMEYTTDYKVARELGCNERMVQAAEHMAKQRSNGEIGWAPEMRNLLDAKRIEEKFGVVMALRALIMQAPAMEREVVETQLRERFGDIPGAAKKVKALGI
jgi:hypothetical protein